jgi:ABC-2 type transport system permease protein
VTEAFNESEALAAVRSGDADVAVLAPASAGGPPRLVGDEEVPPEVVDALTVSPEVTLLNPPRLETGMRYVLSLAFGILYLLMGTMFGQMIAQNTVVEKQTRIVEILVAAVPTRAMLVGKILGGTILAVGDTVLVVGTVYLGLRMNHLESLLTLLTAPMWWYVAFFLVGFAMFAAMFAATGALVSRTEDLGSVSTPILLLVMAPYILVIALNDSPLAMSVMSYVPFTSPVAMPVEMVLGEAGPAEGLTSLAILAATAVVITLLAARIYRRSVLQTGSRIKVSHALRGAGQA